MHYLHVFFRSSSSPNCPVHSIHLCNDWAAVLPYLHSPGCSVPYNYTDITWLAPDGSSLQSGNGTTVGQPVENGNVTTLNFTIDQLAQSHTGNYTCRARISIDKAGIEGACGHVMAEVTVISYHGNKLFLFSTLVSITVVIVGTTPYVHTAMVS